MWVRLPSSVPKHLPRGLGLERAIAEDVLLRSVGLLLELQPALERGDAQVRSGSAGSAAADLDDLEEVSHRAGALGAMACQVLGSAVLGDRVEPEGLGWLLELLGAEPRDRSGWPKLRRGDGADGWRTAFALSILARGRGCCLRTAAGHLVVECAQTPSPAAREAVARIEPRGRWSRAPGRDRWVAPTAALQRG
ncbi:MAG: hypothetical protein GC161_09775 [Planctomycetaceae bacterium]|nr:hypothetical protein [Planctomycetaceae bacterium]